jgi:hypothetical protein
MNPRELKMQPTIHLEGKAGYGRGKYPALPSKCIVGCIFNSVGLIIIREIPRMDDKRHCFFTPSERGLKNILIFNISKLIQGDSKRRHQLLAVVQNTVRTQKN